MRPNDFDKKGYIEIVQFVCFLTKLTLNLA